MPNCRSKCVHNRFYSIKRLFCSTPVFCSRDTEFKSAAYRQAQAASGAGAGAGFGAGAGAGAAIANGRALPLIVAGGDPSVR